MFRNESAASSLSFHCKRDSALSIPHAASPLPATNLSEWRLPQIQKKSLLGDSVQNLRIYLKCKEVRRRSMVLRRLSRRGKIASQELQEFFCVILEAIQDRVGTSIECISCLRDHHEIMIESCAGVCVCQESRQGGTLILP